MSRVGSNHRVLIKNSHIRLFPESGDRHIQDNNKNAVPGTVVDSDITTSDRRVFDYYLQSHGSIL